MVAHWLQNSMQFPLLKNLPWGTGVTLFFVLSGFLITKILLDFKERNETAGKGHLKSIKAFYIRRSLRIFPIYYLTIFFLLLINFHDIEKLFPWLATYTTNVYMTLNGKYIGPYTHFWSLAVEEQFYLFWVFVIVFVPKKHLKKTILAFITISLFLLYYFKFYTSYWLAHSLVICAMHTLGFGALIAYYVKHHPDLIKKINLSNVKAVLLVLIIIFILVFVYRKPDSLYESFKHYKNPFVSVIYGIVVFIAIREGFTGFLKLMLENKIMIYIGRISYGLYVYHFFMNPLYFQFLNKYLNFTTTNVGYFLIFIVLNIILASLSWYLIEKPINGLKRFFKY